MHDVTDIDDCAQAVCMNGATCLDGVTSYTCQCARGFQGRFCEQSKTIWMDSQPCCAARFEQVLLIAGYICSQAQLTELHCACTAYAEPSRLIPCCYVSFCCLRAGISRCLGVTCQNGGFCVSGDVSFTCVCQPGFEGRLCETSACSLCTDSHSESTLSARISAVIESVKYI